ncbi:hypothetical protein [Rhodococcus sp. BP22]|uniref:hypothetical protein n=1 Tax=Rhodococcus sp. BP22 TaxID=2758566 RepID=UPI00164648B7|nr:hypothetical protein [Rhodococcus sp. BP22]
MLALLQDESFSRVAGVDTVVQPRLGKHTSITVGAKTVITQSLSNTAADKARHIDSRHPMLALLDRWLSSSRNLSSTGAQ